MGENESGLAEKCWFPAGLDCIDRASISSTGISFALKNNLISSLVITDVKLLCPATDKTIAVGSANSSYAALPVVVPQDEIFKVRIICDFDKKDRIKETVELTYIREETGLTNKAEGVIVGRVR